MFKKSTLKIVSLLLIITAVLPYSSVFASELDTLANDLVSDFSVNSYFEKTDNGIQYVYNNSDLLTPQTKRGILKNSETLPSKYDLRNVDGKSYVTPVKDQGTTSACWSFATISSMESNILKQGNADVSSLDLSERQLAWYTYNGENSNKRSKYAGGDTFLPNTSSDISANDKAICKANNINANDYAVYTTGGNNFFAISTLARGYGAEDDTKCAFGNATYNGKTYTCFSGKPSTDTQTVCDIALQEAIQLPETYATKDTSKSNLLSSSVNAIKKAIYDNGAVSVGFCSSTNYYNKNKHSYYCSNAKENEDHGVSIVGWDDSYSKSNFGKTSPKGNGAWIVKNNWGTTWGENGYFYLSYYDKSLSNAVSYVMEDKTYTTDNTGGKYEQTYQYNGIIGRGITLNQEVLSANIFTARDTEIVRALSFDTSYANTKTQLEVYLNPTDSNPTSGTKIFQKTISKSYAGYYTYDLSQSEQFVVSKGESYSVVISQATEIDNQKSYILCNEATANSSDSEAFSIDNKSGETYVRWPLKTGGYTWLDSTSKDFQAIGINKIGGATVKVHTDNIELVNITLTSYPKKVPAGNKFNSDKVKFVAEYNDGQKRTLSGSVATITGFNKNKLGNQTLTLKYTVDDVTKYLSFTTKVIKGTQQIRGCKKKYIKTVGCKSFLLGCKAKTKLSYKSSNKGIATVSSKGRVTIKKAGKVKIIVTAKKSRIYKTTHKTVIINVKPKK